MCGIVGFAKRDCLGNLYEGLKTLEYRGYDSAGVAYMQQGRLVVRKKKGRVERLRRFLYTHHADVAMGHTRWATHGAPSAVNAHPHVWGDYAVVHNGIISNYHALREELERLGHRFASDTDTEVIAHLLDYYTVDADVSAAIARTVARLEGNWAVAALYRPHQDRVYLFKRGNPLLLGEGRDFYCFASDAPALVPYTRNLYKMADGQVAVLSRERVAVWQDGQAVRPAFVLTPLKPESVILGDYPCYMRKEMADIPMALANTWQSIHSVPMPTDRLRNAQKLVFVGCGTAYHACLYAAGLPLAVPHTAVVASEFDPDALGVDADTVVVAVSQSGETADTLESVRAASAKGAYVLGLTNVPGSGLTNVVDMALVTEAGAEIAVAATKSYCTQLLGLRYVWTVWRPMPAVCGLLDAARTVARRLPALDAVPCRRFARVCLLAKGRDYATCLEGALKIKEVAYLPCEICYAGEIKHGPLACVTSSTLVVALCTDARTAARMATALHEVRTRGADALVVSNVEELRRLGRWSFALPEADPDWVPILSVQPLQYLAYRMAVARGLDPDKPRNLAKSVTVE